MQGKATLSCVEGMQIVRSICPVSPGLTPVIITVGWIPHLHPDPPGREGSQH